MLQIIEQIIKDTNMMFSSFSVIHSQSYISWMVKEFVRLLKKLFLICASVQTTVDDLNTTKSKRPMKNQDMKSRFFKFQTIFVLKCFFVNDKSALLVAFVKQFMPALQSFYSKLHLLVLLRHKSLILLQRVGKSLLMFVYLSCRKSSKNGSRKTCITRECLIVRGLVGPHMEASVDWFIIFFLILMT